MSQQICVIILLYTTCSVEQIFAKSITAIDTTTRTNISTEQEMSIITDDATTSIMSVDTTPTNLPTIESTIMNDNVIQVEESSIITVDMMTNVTTSTNLPKEEKTSIITVDPTDSIMSADTAPTNIPTIESTIMNDDDNVIRTEESPIITVDTITNITTSTNLSNDENTSLISENTVSSEETTIPIEYNYFILCLPIILSIIATVIGTVKLRKIKSRQGSYSLMIW